MSLELASMLCVYLLYHHGRRFPDKSLFGYEVKGRGENLYQHAEDFLVRLEMLTPNELWERLQRVAKEQIAEDWKSTGHWFGPGDEKKDRVIHNEIVDRAFRTVHRANRQGTTDLIVDAAKKLMAYECSAFHVEVINAYKELVPTETIEPYLPYRRFGTLLQPGEDVLVSFNYDLVVELVVQPKDVELFKLHGSIHETKTPGGGVVRDDPTYNLLLVEGRIPSIKTPGRSKADMNNHDIHIWEKAKGALRDAEKVIFLGYGLPESDAYARYTILEALRDNQSTFLEVEIVLGEETFRTRRLKTMIERALGHRSRDEAKWDEVWWKTSSKKSAIEQFEAVESVGASDAQDRRYVIKTMERELAQWGKFRGLKVSVLEVYAQDYMAALSEPTPNPVPSLEANT